MHAHNVVDNQIAAQGVVLGIVNEEPAGIAGHHVVLDQGVLDGAQHDAMIGVAPCAVVAHDLIAHLHQREAAPVEVDVIVFPQVVVGVHVMRAVAAVVQAVATEDRMVRNIDVDRIPHEADVVADNARAGRVVELDAVAALGGSVFALAGDGVVFDAHVVGLLDPQAEQVVADGAVAHHGAVRARPDVDARILIEQAVSGIAHVDAVNHHILGGDAQGVALVTATDRGPINAFEGQRLVDEQSLPVEPALHPHHIARLGLRDGGGDGFALAHCQLGGKPGADSQQQACKNAH